jgi:urease beta subunit
LAFAWSLRIESARRITPIARDQHGRVRSRQGSAFEPGPTRDVTLVALAGTQTIYGFRQYVLGRLEKATGRPKPAR